MTFSDPTCDSPPPAHPTTPLPVAVILAVALFFPFLQLAFVVPGSGLETSWVQVLHYAFSHGFVWGKDIIFTYGPWGFVLHDVFFPDTFRLAFSIQVAMTAGFSALLARGFLCQSTPRSVVVFVALLFASALSYATLVFAPFLVAMFATAPNGRSRPLWWPLAIAIALLSLLALAKFSLFPVFVAWVCLSAVAFWHASHRVLAGAVVGGSIAAICLWWAAAGQPLSALGPYLQASLEISRYYNGAMGIDPGATVTAFGFAAVAALILLALWRSKRARYDPATLLRCLFYLSVAAIAWKAGMVRADAHVAIFFAVAAIAALLICFDHGVALPRLASWLTIGFAAGCLYYAGLAFHWPVNPLKQASRAALVSVHAASRNLDALTGPQALFHKKRAQLSRAQAQLALPQTAAVVGDATIDLFTHDQSVIFANHFNYDPRPIFQSYSAYSPGLQAINARHFVGPDAPQYVLFQLQTIDGRLPMQADAQAVLQLLRSYKPVLSENDWLLLKLTGDAPAASPDSAPTVRDLRATLGSSVPVPRPADGGLWLTLDLQPTVLGALYSAVLREPQLEMEITTRQGHRIKRRLIRPTARSGFLVAPLYRNTAEFAKLYSGAARDTARSFQIHAPRLFGLPLFQTNYSYTLSTARLGQDHRSNGAKHTK
ncbi:MAG TPA: hypothetical protein VFH57_02475 [Gammaproteobacteria bacterium]|nr:hypothetical protein [Gammaproteobacteria bacterium]